MPVVKDFLIIFRKKSHSADFLPEQTLDFILHRLLAGLAEMDTDKIGSLADGSLECRARFGFRCVCGLCHRKSSCKKIVVRKRRRQGGNFKVSITTLPPLPS